MFRFSVNRIWLLLLLATGITYWLGESGQVGHGGIGPVLAIFGMALVKGWWIIEDFMELRHAPALWRRLLIGWLLFVIGMILLAYWLALPDRALSVS
jgi:cytochrome c oxidase subunit 4